MAMVRPTIVDSDGSPGTGTIADAAWVDDFCDRIDAALGGGGLATCEGRLTLTTGVPVTTADVTAATNVYWTPYQGNVVALYSGTAWVFRTFAETTLALGTVTSGLPYDIFAYDNAGTLALEKLAWTNGTTRATALVRQDGVLVKTGALTRRYLGTIYTTSTTTTEDSQTKRLVWNYYNRVRRPMLRNETAASWTYNTATYRQANANTANQLAVMVGVAEDAVAVALQVSARNASANASIGAALGYDSTTAVATGSAEGTTQSLGGLFANHLIAVFANITFYPSAGYHYFAWLERNEAAGTTTVFGQTSSVLNGTVMA